MRLTNGTIITLVGAVVLRLTLGGTYKRYVRVGMYPWLLLAGAALVLLGVTIVVLALRAGPAGASAGPGAADAAGPAEEEHEHGGRIGWLLLAPIAALLLVAPPTLGSFGVDRGTPVDVRSGKGGFAKLPTSGGPVPMTLLEYGQRAFDGDGSNFNGATVALTGFVAAGGGTGSFRLARFQIACCAADAAAALVLVVGVDGAPPPRDHWVVVTGRFRPAGGETPELTALGVQEIPAPEDPYE